MTSVSATVPVVLVGCWTLMLGKEVPTWFEMFEVIGWKVAIAPV